MNIPSLLSQINDFVIRSTKVTNMFVIFERMKKSYIFLILIFLFSCEKDSPLPLPNPDPIEYSLNLNVSPAGAGTLSQSSGVFSENKTVSVLATANENYNFEGWTGSLTSNENPLSITMDSDKTITANFSENELCEIDYKTLHSGINTLTSHYQPMNVPFIDYADILNVILEKYGSYAIWTAFGNFNNNDKSDYIMASGDWENPSGNEIAVVIDDQIAHRFKNPQTQTRKVAVKDLNLDGTDEIILFGTGPDIGNSPGDKIFIVNVDQTEEVNAYSGYFHTGSVGDLNNDNFPDIIGIDAQQAFTGGGNIKYYENDFENGWLEKETNIPSLWVSRNYHCELFDFDSDGNLDLILGGHEWEEEWMSTANGTVQWKTHILRGLGDGQFDIENPILLPELNYWGIITDFDIYDIDNDGQFELIITRTSGRDGLSGLPIDNEGYDGHIIQILKNDGNNWNSWKLVEQPTEIFDNPDIHIEWPYNTKIYDVNNDCLLDIVPESDKLNAKSFTHLNSVRGLYYEQQTNGNFLIKYKE